MLMQIFESWFAFFNRECISYSAQYIFKKYWQQYFPLCKDVIVKPYSSDITL